MRITKYRTKQTFEGQVYLVKENAVNYKGASEKLNSPKEIVSMLNDVFDLCHETEEYLYLLCFKTSFALCGIFEVSHGTVRTSFASPREIMQKALLCNASTFVIAHNHPGGSILPSSCDDEVVKRLQEVGKLMEVPITDSLIIADNQYFSYSEENRIIGENKL